MLIQVRCPPCSEMLRSEQSIEIQNWVNLTTQTFLNWREGLSTSTNIDVAKTVVHDRIGKYLTSSRQW
jgi:hypothetical protein